MKQFVEVHYLARSGMRQAFYDALMQNGIADKSRAEEGNEMYAYWFSPDNENELLPFEIFHLEGTLDLVGRKAGLGGHKTLCKFQAGHFQ